MAGPKPLRSILVVALTLAALLSVGAVTAVAAIAPPATQPPASTSPTPAPASEVPAEPPVAGRMRLVVQHAHGRPPFAVVGERIVIAGGVRPYVAGQKVLVTVYRDGRRVLSKRLGVGIVGNGTGQFHLAYASPRAGLVSVKAVHVATPQLGALSAKSPGVRFLGANLGIGASGRAVRVLQDGLAALRYEAPVSGRFDEATARAVIAYRKMTGLQRVETVNSRIFGLLQRGAGGFRSRYPGDGNHVEADLSRQVLVELEPHGRVRRIYTMSSGKPSTPSVVGRFRVYYKTPGTNEKGMVDSNYFIRGYAIHGYAEVPVYAASHGCLRIPIPNAAAVFAWVQSGYPVDVYNDYGGGSHHVSGNAGP
jgi:peptidoglycan hydrolase-like protein with peptidoglycan-binding domain